MKLVLSIIRPYHLELVQKALEKEGIFLTSISEVVSGYPEPGYKLIYRDREIHARRPKCRAEMIIEDWQAENIVELIRASTVAGCPDGVSDAKIMVMQMEDCDAPKNRARESLPARVKREALCAN